MKKHYFAPYLVLYSCEQPDILTTSDPYAADANWDLEQPTRL